MPPKKTPAKSPVVRPKTPAKTPTKTVRATTPVKTPTKTVRTKTPALVEGEAKKAASVRIPELDLNYEAPKPTAEAVRRIPELKLTQRRGWKGDPLPFDTEAGALAWGINNLKIKELRGSLASKSEKYTKSRRMVRELQNDVTAAANRHGKHVDFVGKQLAEWRRIRVPRPSGPGSGKGSAWPNVNLSFDQLSDSTDVEGGAIRAYPAGARRASTIPRAGTR